MKQLFSNWWVSKSEQEQADLESSLAIILSSLSFLPALIIVWL